MSEAFDLSNSVIFPKGDKFESDNFKDTVWLNMLTSFDTACPIGNVTFEPNCQSQIQRNRPVRLWQIERTGYPMLLRECSKKRYNR